MPKKAKKLTELHQTHGKLEEAVNIKNTPRTLDQILGDDGTSKYGTVILDEYSDYLDNLNKSDLQTHAAKIGLVPIDNREILTSRLKKEFVKHVSGYKAKSLDDKEVTNIKRAKDILSEGR